MPLESVVRTRRQTGPLSINHFGQLPAVTVSFNLRPGFSLGEAAQQVDETIRQMRMPATIGTSFQGTVKEFQSSFANLSILLLIAILVIYIVLGVLYESFIHPITILSGLPSAVFGALLTLLIFHKELDLYAFVGIIMLFGVVKKNAIMMIDFAIDAQKKGRSAYDAIWRGLPAALPPHHDDDGGRPVRHAADRAGLRRRRGCPPAPGPRSGRRSRGQPVPDTLHYAGHLPLPGASAGAAAGSTGRAARGRSRELTGSSHVLTTVYIQCMYNGAGGR